MTLLSIMWVQVILLLFAGGTQTTSVLATRNYLAPDQTPSQNPIYHKIQLPILSYPQTILQRSAN